MARHEPIRIDRRYNTPERIWSKVERTETCWLWTAYRNAAGYGVVRFQGRQQLAHRVAWELAIGPIPDGFCVLHACDTPPCCNVTGHLFLGTKLDNIRDMRQKGREHYLKGDQCYQRQHPERNRRGEQLTWTKLTEADVRVIRAAYATGTTRSELAHTFGLGWSTIDHIVHRRSWKHVE